MLAGCTPVVGNPGPALMRMGALKNGGPSGPAAAVSTIETLDSDTCTEEDASNNCSPGPEPPEMTELRIANTPCSGPGESSYESVAPPSAASLQPTSKKSVPPLVGQTVKQSSKRRRCGCSGATTRQLSTKDATNGRTLRFGGCLRVCNHPKSLKCFDCHWHRIRESGSMQRNRR